MTTRSRVPPLLSSAACATDDLLDRIRGEYLEMPRLRLTLAQAARLWALDVELAGELLAALVETGFLIAAADGRHARRGDSSNR